MKKLIPASLLLATLALLGAVALHARPEQADPAAANQHRQKPFKPGALKKHLALTDDQVAKIKTEFAAQKDTLHVQARKVRDARAQLRDAIQSGAPETAIRAAAANIGTAEGDLAMERASLFARIKPILTPEQLEKLHSLQASRPDHR